MDIPERILQVWGFPGDWDKYAEICIANSDYSQGQGAVILAARINYIWKFTVPLEFINPAFAPVTGVSKPQFVDASPDAMRAILLAKVFNDMGVAA